jgi:hypothetical protein
MTGDGMTEHLPECPILKPCCDDEEFPEHGYCGNYVGRCLHCMAECICEQLGVCANRVARGERARIALEIDTLMRRVMRHPNGKPESGYFEGVDDVLGILLTRIMQ